MGSIIGWAMRFRLLMVAVAAGVVGVGIVAMRDAPVDVLPEFTPPYAEVQTEALGLSAEEVEQLITVPLEADLLNGVEGVEVIRSESVPGLSSIVMVFAPDTDIYRARQLVEERLTQAHALPNVSKPPTLLQPLSSSNRVLMIGLSSDNLSSIEQSVIARWTVRPRLMGVPGVANVSVWGMRDQQLQVEVDPAVLRERQVTLNQIIRTAGNAQVVSPLSFLEASTPGTGGFIETPQQRLQVRHLIEKIADPEDFGKVPVEGTGRRLQLADVADIGVGHQPLIGDALVAGESGLMLVVEKLPGASTLEVTEGVEDALRALQPGLTGISTDTSVFRPASYLEDALGNVALALVIGGALMLLALAAIRFRWRAVLMTAVTVPLSLLAACLVLILMDQEFNALALAGLAAAVAVVVDEAVVPTDRVVRRLRRLQRGGAEASLAAAVRQASAEVRRPLVYATVIALLAIVPVAFMAGRPGAFFGPLVLAYVLAVVAAMAVALTVTPALTMMLFARWQPTPRAGASNSGRWRGLSQRTRVRYLAALSRFSSRRRTPLLAAGACLLVGVAVVPFLSSALIPAFHDRDVLVRLEGAPGTSNPRMAEIATDVVRRLQDVDGVDNVGAHVGRAVTGDRVTNVSSSDVWVTMAPDADFDATMSAIDDTVGEVDGVAHDVVTYSAQKMRDVGALASGDNQATGNGLSVLTGISQPLAVRVFGEDSDVLRAEANKVADAMAQVDGVVDPRVVLPTMQPTIEIEVDLDRAQQFGVTPGDVRRAEATLLQGIQVGSVFEEQKVFDVIVRGTPSTRGSVDDVRNLLIDRPGGGYLRLGQVADVRVVDTPSVIRRDAVSRRLDVEAGINGRDAEAVAADIEAVLAEMALPMEYHAEVVTQTTADEIAGSRMLGFAVAALIAGFLLLQAATRSWRLAALLVVLLPLSLVGGLVFALLDGAELSLGSMVGLLAVFGLATRAGLLMVDELQSRETGNGARGKQILRGALERLGPVVASASALALLVLPIAILGVRPGLELLHPMSLVLLGGLVSTSFVTLFLLPALYLHLLSGEPRPAEADSEVAPDWVDLTVSEDAGRSGEPQPAGPKER